MLHRNARAEFHKVTLRTPVRETRSRVRFCVATLVAAATLGTVGCTGDPSEAMFTIGPAPTAESPVPHATTTPRESESDATDDVKRRCGITADEVGKIVAVEPATVSVDSLYPGGGRDLSCQFSSDSAYVEIEILPISGDSGNGKTRKRYYQYEFEGETITDIEIENTDDAFRVDPRGNVVFWWNGYVFDVIVGRCEDKCEPSDRTELALEIATIVAQHSTEMALP